MTDCTTLGRPAAPVPRQGDRRRGGWRTLVYGTVHRRRRGPRRAAEMNGRHYPDRYQPSLLISALAILSLCILDAVFTLTLLARGAAEVNPVMAWLLAVDVQLFAAAKMALTGLGVVILAAHAHFRLLRSLRVSHIYHALVPGYLALIGWELFLLSGPGA